MTVHCYCNNNSSSSTTTTCTKSHPSWILPIAKIIQKGADADVAVNAIISICCTHQNCSTSRTQRNPVALSPKTILSLPPHLYAILQEVAMTGTSSTLPWRYTTVLSRSNCATWEDVNAHGTKDTVGNTVEGSCVCLWDAIRTAIDLVLDYYYYWECGGYKVRPAERKAHEDVVQWADRNVSTTSPQQQQQQQYSTAKRVSEHSQQQEQQTAEVFQQRSIAY
jgi:hypothetical protein